ncbi:MAG: hypothetical protein EYC70_01775 [Planctomycetota bacterium]|nr:MAG: hypothetical protein EYC70_01775 [Planctomycetota bacterium]
MNATSWMKVLLLAAAFAPVACTKGDDSVESVVDDIPTEDEAAAKAAQQITPDNAAAEADKLEKELDDELK